MPTYLERYLAGEREEVWAELSARGPAIRADPLFAEAQAVARETMTRARANVALLVQRLTSLGYRFIGGALGPRPTPYAPPSGESLAALRELEHQYGPLPLSIETWYEVVGAVDLMGVYPRLSTFEGLGAGGYVDMMLGGERIRIRGDFPFYASSPAPAPNPDSDASIVADPLVVWPCSDVLVDELDLPPGEAGSGPRVQYSLGFAPDAQHKANHSGGDGPNIAFGEASMDAPLQGDDWEGVPFVSYLRTAFAWGGFPGLRGAVDPPRDLLATLCDGLQPL